MPLFGHRRHTTGTTPGQAGGPGTGIAMPQSWQPVTGRPFEEHLERLIQETSRIMYGIPRIFPQFPGVGDIRFTDAFRTSTDGRAVTVANAWTVVEPGLFGPGKGTPGVAVCAVELPSVLPVAWIRPRRFSGPAPVGEARTGNPAFDDHYQVIGTPAPLAAVAGLNAPQDVVTVDVQQRVMAHDDWAFMAERYLLGCVSKGAFRSADEISIRVGEVMDIVAAIPTSVMPRHVDHSQDGLVARISQLDSVDDAIAMLQQLTPGERDSLARSGTPLAAFADVRTPEEAIARFESLDPQRRMQIIAMFMRAEDGQ